MQRICDVQISENQCYCRLNNCNTDEYTNIINYKSWLFKSWETGTERRYFVFPYLNRDNSRIVKTSVGFAPVLIRYLQGLGYLINGKEVFRAKEMSLNDTLFKPYDFQQDAIKSWMNSGCLGIVKSPTGSGKSYLACKIIQQMRLKTIISVHTNDLLINAWLNTLVEQFGESIKSRIGIIGGKLSKKDRKNMRLIPSTSYEANIQQDIVIATSQSLLNKLDKLCNEKFGLLVVDEAHHYSSDQFSRVASNIRAPYRLGLSATTTRPDGTSPLFFGLLGDICFKINIRELVNKGILVDPIFYSIIINDEKAQSEIASCGLAKLDLARYVKQKSASSVTKVKYVLNLIESLCRNRKKFVIYTDFVNSENSAVFTRDFYVEELNRRGVKVIGVSSDMTGTERSKVFSMLENGKLDGIVFGLLGSEGVNIPRIDSVVMCNGTKSTIRYTQRVGRSMRVAKDDANKRNAFIYEIILNTPMEKRWMDANFHEYETEGYNKELIQVK